MLSDETDLSILGSLRSQFILKLEIFCETSK